MKLFACLKWKFRIRFENRWSHWGRFRERYIVVLGASLDTETPAFYRNRTVVFDLTVMNVAMKVEVQLNEEKTYEIKAV